MRECRQCGVQIDTEKQNVLYCPECAKARKKAADAEAWIRRRKKEEDKRRDDPAVKKKKLLMHERVYADLLGLTDAEFAVWKQNNPELYAEWYNIRKRNWSI